MFHVLGVICSKERFELYSKALIIRINQAEVIRKKTLWSSKKTYSKIMGQKYDVELLMYSCIYASPF